MTTMDSESRMVCVSPTMICGIAYGSSTFQSNCRRVAPKARPASISGLGVDEIPRCVSRIGAGMAKMTVAMSPGTIPSPKRMSAGMR